MLALGEIVKCLKLAQRQKDTDPHHPKDTADGNSKRVMMA